MTLPKLCPCLYDTGGNDTIENAVAAWWFAHHKAIGTKENNRNAPWRDVPQGTPKGRFNTVGGVRTELCLPAKEFARFAEKRGIDPSHIRELFKSRPVRPAPYTEPIRCTIIPQVK